MTARRGPAPARLVAAGLALGVAAAASPVAGCDTPVPVLQLQLFFGLV